MKSIIYTLTFFLFCSIQFLQAQIIPGGSMDNWTTYELYETPPPFETTNLQSFILGGDYSVTQVPGVTGSAVRLETILADGELIPGLIFFGDLDNLGGGIPLTATPESVSLSLRYDVPAGDTAIVALIFSKDGLNNGFVQSLVMGSQNDFSEITLNVPPLLGVPDSVTFIAFSSNIDNPVLGGFLEIDDIILNGTPDEIPNGDFEIWESVEYDEVDNFSSFNPFQALFGLVPTATQTSDAVVGNSAIRIENVEVLDFDNGGFDTIGFIFSGDLFSEYASFPISGTPPLISGYYKFAPVGNDSATIFLSFTKYNPLIGESEIVAEFNYHLGESSTYVPFEFPLSFGETPDSFSIGMASFNVDNIDGFVPLGSVLHIDEVSFDFIEGVKIPIFSDALEVYPNPASDYIFIKTDEAIGTPKSIQLTDATGRVIQVSDTGKLEFGNDQLRIDTRSFPTGMYYYKIETEESAYAGKVMIQR